MSELSGLADRYPKDNEAVLLDAGSQLVSGKYEIERIRELARWKSPRRASLIDENSEQVLREAIALVSEPQRSEVLAIGILTSLSGVGIPMASSILTAMFPLKYTIIDYRALATLGVEKWTGSIEFYLAYLEFCLATSKSAGLSLRSLDHALWQRSKEQK